MIIFMYLYAVEENLKKDNNNYIKWKLYKIINKKI